MKVKLLHNTPLHIASTAIRTCWQSQEKSDSRFSFNCSNCSWPLEESCGRVQVCPECGSKNSTGSLKVGPNDKALIDRVGNKNKHSSTLEHLTYTFYISGVSRALLQELARHRMSSPSVKSTRYTLKELKDEAPFLPFIDFERAGKYIVYTNVQSVDKSSVVALENLRCVLVDGVANDRAKYCLPESYKTELTWTINARSLQNFLHLRTSKSALWEIRDLANAIYEELPLEHKYLFTDILCKD